MANWTRWMPVVALAATGCPDRELPVKVQPPNVSLPEVSCTREVVLAGTKQAATSIWVDGVEVVVWDESTSFMATIVLKEGRNVLSVTARSANGDLSEPVLLETNVVTEPPAPPVVTTWPRVTDEPSATVAGMRAPGTTVLLAGQECAGTDTTWTHQVPLHEGENRLLVVARDMCRESAPIEINPVYAPRGRPYATIDRTSFAPKACASPQILSGEKGAEDTVTVNGMPATTVDATHWRYTANLRAGRNVFVIVAHRGADSSPPIEVVILFADAPPAPPEVDAKPAEITREPTLVLRGSKPENTAITVNGDRGSKPDESTSWSATIMLHEGLNRIVIDTEDFCRRVSGDPYIRNVTLDTTPPAVHIAFPTQNQLVAGTVTIRGEAMDNLGLEKVEVAIDGAPFAMLPMSEMWSVVWDTRRVPDGLHTITAVGVDRAGNRSMPGDRVDVTVANEPRLVSSDMPGGFEPRPSTSPDIAALTGGDNAIVWQDTYAGYEQGGDDDIFLRVYAGGLTATPIVAVSTHPADGRSRNPAISAGPGGVANIVWADDGDIDGDRHVEDDIVFRQRQANGMLGPIVLVSRETQATGSGDSKFPAIATDPTTGLVHVVWEDDGDLDGDGQADADIYYAAGGPGGFNAPVLISTAPNDGSSTRPKIALTPDGCPHVVWQDTGDLADGDSDGRFDVYYRGSTANALGGCTFDRIKLVSEEPGFGVAQAPAIAADRDGAGLLWIAFQGTGAVRVSNGITLGPDAEVYLRDVQGGDTGPLIAVSDYANDDVTGSPTLSVSDDGDVHVVFTETGNILGHGTDPDLFLRTFRGGPLTMPDDLGLTNVGLSLAPKIVTRDAQRLIVWQDSSPYDGDAVDDFDIMYVAR